MRAFLLVVLVALVGAVVCDDKYTTKYDNVDLDEILRNDRLLKSYINCLMERGNCTPDGREIKKNIRDALENDCSKCSEKQQVGLRRILKYLVENKRPWFDELAAKYDPEGHYRARYKDEYAKEGIVF